MFSEDIISIIRKDDHRGSNDRTIISSVKEMNIHKKRFVTITMMILY